MNANRVIHFEIPADEPERAVAFYRAAFGWTIECREGPVEYWTAKTGEGPGINGAFVRRGPVRETTNTIAVADLDAAIAAVEGLGGAVEGEPMTIAGAGRFCYARDTEGNLFGMMQRDVPEIRSTHHSRNEDR